MMTTARTRWLTNQTQLLTLAGVTLACGAFLVNLGFFFRAGTSEVLTGLAYNGFVLGWLLVLTAGTRTVSLSTLGIFWLLGLWTVLGAEYVLEKPMAVAFGSESGFVPVWWSPLTSEGLKTLAVAMFFVFAYRGGNRRLSMSDGLLLGFVVGAGFKFHEDAHIGIVTGDGWGAVPVLSAVFPTIESWNDLVYNDHAVRGALEGLSVGAAAMLWHWRAARLIGLAGPALMFLGHVKWNYFATEGTADPPFVFSTLRDLLDGGRLPLEVLLVGTAAAVLGDTLILRWVGKRDRMFPSLSSARLLDLLKGWNTSLGLTQLLAAERYVCLRRSIYYSGWQTELAGGTPVVAYMDYETLNSLGTRLDVRPSAVPAN